MERLGEQLGIKSIRVSRDDVVDLTTEDNVIDGPPGPAAVVKKKGPKRVIKVKQNDKEKEKEKENEHEHDEEADDGDDFVKKPAKAPAKRQAKLQVGNGGVACAPRPSSSDHHRPPAREIATAADYVVDVAANQAAGGPMDEYDLKMNKLRVELRDTSNERSLLEAKERRIRKDMRALEKKRNDRLISQRNLVFSSPGKDLYTESDMAKLFPETVGVVEQPALQETEEEAELRRKQRTTRPLYALASMHSQVESEVGVREDYLEVHQCYLLPLAQCGAAGDADVQSASDKADDVSKRREGNGLTVFSQIDLLFDEAAEVEQEEEGEKEEEEEQQEGNGNGSGGCHRGHHDARYSQNQHQSLVQPPMSLAYESRHLDSLFSQQQQSGNDGAGSPAQQSPIIAAAPMTSTQRAESWKQEHRQFVRLVSSCTNPSQFAGRSQELCEGLSKFSALWEEIFSSLALTHDDDIGVSPAPAHAFASIDSVSSVNTALQHVLEKNESILKELQTNMERLLREQCARGSCDEGLETFLQGMLASCFTARVFSDAALFGSLQSSTVYNLLKQQQQQQQQRSLLQAPPPTPPSSIHHQHQQAWTRQSDSLSPPQSNGVLAEQSPYNPNDYCDDGIMYGGGSFYDPDDGDDNNRDTMQFAAGTNDEPIDLITPDSQPRVAPSQNHADSGGQEEVAEEEIVSYFTEHVYASGVCPDFKRMSIALFGYNCSHVGLPVPRAGLTRDEIAPMLVQVWESGLADWQKAAALNKNKRLPPKAAAADKPKTKKPREDPLVGAMTLDNDATALGKLKMSVEQIRQVVDFIQANDAIYESILLFRPLSLDEVHSALLGASPSISVAKEHLKALLDSQAVFAQQGSLGDKYAARAGGVRGK